MPRRTKTPFKANTKAWQAARILLDGKPHHSGEIAAKLGCHQTVVSNTRIRLEEQGYKFIHDGYRWQLATEEESNNGSQIEPKIQPISWVTVLERAFPKGVPINKVELAAHWLAVSQELFQN